MRHNADQTLKTVLLLMILLLVLGLSAARAYKNYSGIIRNISRKAEDEKYYEQLRTSASSYSADEKMLRSYDSFLDLAGWVSIPDTDISYPVMSEEEASVGFYLDHRPDGASSSYGSLFIPAGNLPSDDNVIIYGHHMRNGSMFGELGKYKDEEWAHEHRTITFLTEEGLYSYEVISVFVQSMASSGYRWEDKISFADDASKEEYRQKITALSMFRLEDGHREYTRFITLVTCDYSVPEGRVVVVGAL
ncbi:MAG: class B sortase [Saccharofermentans sp.]|nr:class B sortase [Saccharofermentans sp.]